LSGSWVSTVGVQVHTFGTRTAIIGTPKVPSVSSLMLVGTVVIASEYIVKMKGFSHADRIGGRIDLLDPKRIQTTICKGKDIFGMLPEAYSVGLHLLVTDAIQSDVNVLVPGFSLTNEPQSVSHLLYITEVNAHQD